MPRYGNSLFHLIGFPVSSDCMRRDNVICYK
jgi:hypothetical protein